MKCESCKSEMSFIYGWGYRPDKYTCLVCKREIWLESSTIPVKIFKDDHWKSSIDFKEEQIV